MLEVKVWGGHPTCCVQGEGAVQAVCHATSLKMIPGCQCVAVLVLAVVLGYACIAYNPDSLSVAVHGALVARHSLVPVPVAELPTTPSAGEWPSPSVQAVAFDVMLRATKSDEWVDLTLLREDMAEKIGILLESSEVPEEFYEEITVPASQQTAFWTHWEGVSNATDAPTVLYLHGGGRVVGNSSSYIGMFYRLSRSSGARVFGVDYSLAPETPISQAVDDAIDAYEYLLNTCHVEPQKVFVAGESGGGLMASLLIQAIRDRSLPNPAGAWIISPMTDLSASLPSHTENHHRDSMLSGKTYGRMAKFCIGDDSIDPRDPSVSPLYASWANLPPLLFSVSESELLRDDAVEAVKRAQADGTSVRLDLRAHMPHAFPILGSYAPEFTAGFERGAWFIQECLEGKPF